MGTANHGRSQASVRRGDGGSGWGAMAELSPAADGKQGRTSALQASGRARWCRGAVVGRQAPGGRGRSNSGGVGRFGIGSVAGCSSNGRVQSWRSFSRGKQRRVVAGRSQALHSESKVPVLQISGDRGGTGASGLLVPGGGERWPDQRVVGSIGSTSGRSKQ